MCKGCRENPIKVDDLESNREWNDVETKVCNQLLQHCFTPIFSEAKVLHQIVPLAASRTLGMTLRPRRGGSNGRGCNDGFGSD